MATTIQISEELQGELAKRKQFTKETYEEVIWNLIEDTMVLSEETKKDIENARKEIAKGEFMTLDEVKKKFDIS
jgi:predicted transcriptional regulator